MSEGLSGSNSGPRETKKSGYTEIRETKLELFFSEELPSCEKALISLIKHTLKIFQKTLACKFAPDSLFVLRR